MNIYACGAVGFKNNEAEKWETGVTVTYETANSKPEAIDLIEKRYQNKFQDLEILAVEIPTYELCKVILSQKFPPSNTITYTQNETSVPTLEKLADKKLSYFIRSSYLAEMAKDILRGLEYNKKTIIENYNLCTQLFLEKEKLQKEVKRLEGITLENQNENIKLLEEVNRLKQKNNDGLIEQLKEMVQKL